MIIEVGFRLEELHADVDILVMLLHEILDEHRLENYLGIRMGRIEAHLVVEDHDSLRIEDIGSLQSNCVSLVAFEVDNLLAIVWV